MKTEKTLSLRKSNFDHRSVFVGFVVNKLAIKSFFEYLRFVLSLPSSPTLNNHVSFISNRPYKILTADRVVKFSREYYVMLKGLIAFECYWWNVPLISYGTVTGTGSSELHQLLSGLLLLLSPFWICYCSLI